MPDEINIEVVEPGSEDDPFTDSSKVSSNPASATVSAQGQVDGEDEDDDGDDLEDDVTATGDEADEDNDDAALTEEELVALEELETYLQEQATTRVEKEVIPRLQSTYDRQIASIQRDLQQAKSSAQAREKELLDAVREAQMNGLPDTEKARLREQWDYDDRIAALDAREAELTSYHNEILKVTLVQNYGQFGLEVEDLDEFQTPEEMESFAKEVELEYYRLMTSRGAVADDDDDEDEEETPRARTKFTKAKARVPAGAAAPSDGGGGTNVPQAPKFNQGTGPGAMTENLKNLGWDTVKISS